MSDDERGSVDDLFGSEDDEENKDFGRASLRARDGADADGGGAGGGGTEDGLEDDLEVGVTARAGPASEDPGDEPDDGQRGDRRALRPGHRPLAKTGAPIDFAAPLLPVQPPQGEVYLLREALIRIEPKPFNPDTFAGEEEIFVDEKGHSRVKPADRTKIRWRYVARKGPDGREEQVPESNARFVRWSDGSLQLLLGDEVFDVVTADISQQHAYMSAYSGVVQGQAALTSKMGFRLATLNSRLHARMREEVDKRTLKVKKVQGHVEALDPAREKERRAKEAEEVLRGRAQLESRQARTLARYGGGGGGGGGRRGRPELNTRFLEEEDGAEVGGDDGFIDDADAGPGGGGGGGGGSRRRRLNDAEEAEAARRLQSAKRGAPAAAAPAGGKRRRVQAESEEEEAEEAADEDDEEEEYVDSQEDSEEGEEGDEGGGEDEEEEEEEEEEDAGGRRGKGAKATPPPRAKPSQRPEGSKAVSPPARGDGRGPQPRARRGVVLSDDEDD